MNLEIQTSNGPPLWTTAPVLETLKSELIALRQHPQVLPKGKLGRAIDYSLTLWDRMNLCVRHGEIEIDNNLIENGIRPTAVGKKNWLFIGGEATGQRASIIYTLVECAKRRGHDPEAWLADVLTRLPGMTNQDDLTVLLPSRWQPFGTADGQDARQLSAYTVSPSFGLQSNLRLLVVHAVASATVYRVG